MGTGRQRYPPCFAYHSLPRLRVEAGEEWQDVDRRRLAFHHRIMAGRRRRAKGQDRPACRIVGRISGGS
jgi:hypothetical protein